ncbi:retrovirus-related pol polyprotein from transposon TNT 1-94 [Tanacetum coccineum]
MTGTKFDIEKFDGKNDFALWQVRMKALLEQQGLAAVLEELPATTIAAYNNVIQKKSYSALILCLGDRVLREITKETTTAGIWKNLKTLYMTKSLANRLYLKKLYTFHMQPGKSQSEHIDEFHKLVGDLAAIDTAISNEDQTLLLLTSLPLSYDYFVETLLYGRDTLKLEDVLATLNSKELQKMTEAKGDCGEGLYVRGRSGQIDIKQGKDSTWSNVTGFVRNEDQVSGSRADAYDNADVMMAMSVEELLDWIMDSGGSYHITYKRDYLVDFEEYDGGNILLGDGREFRVRGTGYYRRFIANSAKVSKPLASLTQKIRKYEWAKEQEEAFQTLKDNLWDAPILSLPDGSKEFVVYCDASNQGLGKVSKVENVTTEMLRGMDQIIERKEDGGADKTYHELRDMYGGHVWRMILLPMLPRSSSGYDTNWVIVDRLTKRCMEGSVGHMFFGLKLEKFGRLDQNWYKRQQIRVEVGDKVMLEVSSWKDVVHFGKKEMLAPRYKYLADTNLHVHLEEIKVDKTLRFVKEPIEIIDREVESLKRSRIPIVKSIGTRSEFGYQSMERDRLLVIEVMVVMDCVQDLVNYVCSDSFIDDTICVVDDIQDVTPRVSRLGQVWPDCTEPLVYRELQRNKFASQRLPQREGNMNGWLIKDEDEPLKHEASDKELDSDLESTTSSKPKCKKLKKTSKAIPTADASAFCTVLVLMIECFKMALSRRSGPSNEENPDITAIIAQQLQTILPQIFTQVTNNVNNANGRNGGNGGNNGCTYKGFMACNPKEYDGKEVQARGCAAAIGMSRTDFKALLVEEFCPSNEMGKLESEFWNHKMVGANHAGYTDQFHELAKLVPHLVTPESSRIKRYIVGLAPEIRGMLRATQPTTIHSAILRAGILTDEAISCGTLTKGNEKRKGVEESSKK